MESIKLWGFWGRWGAISMFSKGSELATFADPFINITYEHQSFTKHAATTKIPYLLCEKIYFKPWIKCMTLFTKMWWEWEKKTEKETKEKNPRLITLPSPLLRYGVRLFSGIRERRKQAGPTLSGRGSKFYRTKKSGSDAVRTGSMNLFWWVSKIFRKGGLE